MLRGGQRNAGVRRLLLTRFDANFASDEGGRVDETTFFWG
jgi:hypothetical protein